MRVKVLTGKGLIVARWSLNGEYDQGHAPACVGIEIPEGADLIDVAFESDGQQTMQVVFEPAWPGMID